MARALTAIHDAYIGVKLACARSYLGKAAGEAIWLLAQSSLRFLAEQCEPVDLISRVSGKEYFSYVRRGHTKVIARPANRAFFVPDLSDVAKQWAAWQKGSINKRDFARMSYTVALAPCLAMELFDRQNKKGPATYFECLIGHMFAKELGFDPRKQATLQLHGKTIRLTMDFLFEGENGVKIHVPVKMSTRERVVQAWAHQRILDGAHGENSYKGIMVLFSETKLDSRSREVVEICVPDQWLAYQTLLARIERIYYFDVPCRYQTLCEDFPTLLQVKQFGEFFTERKALLAPSSA